MKKSLRTMSILIVLTALLLPLFWSYTAPSAFSAPSASETETGTGTLLAQQRTIKVGWPRQGNLMTVDKAGKPAGYTYEYLMRIKQYTGWDYEFTIVENNDTALTGLLTQLGAGELDIVGGINYKYDAAEEYGYNITFGEYASSYTVLAALANNNKLIAVSDLVKEQIRIATIGRADTTNGLLAEFCKVNHIDYTTVPCEDTASQIAAVKSGTADVMTGVDFMMTGDFRAVAKFNYNPFGFGVSPTAPEILNALNDAIFEIDKSTPQFKNELYQKYFQTDGAALLLSEEETEYIKNAQCVPVLVNPNMAPFQHKDENGNVIGITKDLMELIGSMTGLTFRYELREYNNFIYSLSEKGNFITASLPFDYQQAENLNVQLCTPFVSVPMVYLYNVRSTEKENKDATVAVVFGEDVSELSEFKEIRYYYDIKDCIDAVDAGRVDCAYSNAYSATYYGFQVNYKNLVSVPVRNTNKGYCIAVSRSADTLLLSILNKALRAIDSSTISAIITVNTSNYQQNITLGWLINNYPIQTMLISGAVVLIIVAALVIIFLVKVRANRRLTIDAKRFENLSEISDEYLFEYDVKKDTFVSSPKYAELFGIPKKIEHYKNNNTYAHFLNAVMDDARAVCELQLPLADGADNWFRVYCAKVKDNQQEVISVIGKLVDIEDEKREKLELYEKSVTDDLTKLFKIGYFWDNINEKLREEPRAVGQFLIFDLDKFKEINDTYGHLEGDRVLTEVAKILAEEFRKEDCPARLGGDEFVVYMNGVSKEIALARAEAVLKRVSELPMCGGTVSLSCGICETRNGTDYEAVYRTADKAMYKVKRKGGNAVLTVTEAEPKQ